MISKRTLSPGWLGTHTREPFAFGPGWTILVTALQAAVRMGELTQAEAEALLFQIELDIAMEHALARSRAAREREELGK